MTSTVAIKVERLSKRYRIGVRQQSARTWPARLRRGVVAPFEYLRSSLRGPDDREIFWALRDISMEVHTGEPLAIIGRNGAGKSTLLKILSRITEPTSGRAEMYGRVGSLLEVGTGFHKELSGRENVYMNGAILGMSRAEIDAKFDEIVEFAGVEQFIDTPVKRYSSGMHVRLGFAVAAHLEPEILLIDEVLAVGDAEFQRRCLGKMGEVSRAGRAIVFVSHNMTAVTSICPRAVLLEHGQLVAAGPSEEVVDQYLSRGREDQLEQEWPRVGEAPGNEHVRLKRVAIRPRLGDPAAPITHKTPLAVDVDIWRLSEAKLSVRLFVKRPSGETIFAVTSPQQAPSEGEASFTCFIPGHFMNDGSYTILVEVLRDLRSLFVLEDAVNFDVRDSEREGTWYGKWPGAVRPQFEWQCAGPRSRG